VAGWNLLPSCLNLLLLCWLTLPPAYRDTEALGHSPCPVTGAPLGTCFTFRNRATALLLQSQFHFACSASLPSAYWGTHRYSLHAVERQAQAHADGREDVNPHEAARDNKGSDAQIKRHGSESSGVMEDPSVSTRCSDILHSCSTMIANGLPAKMQLLHTSLALRSVAAE
jgi:hypothetical protein